MLTIHLTTSRKRSSTLIMAVNRVRTVHCVCGEPHLFTVIVSIQSGSNSLWSRLRKSYRGKYKSYARMLGHCILDFFFTATTMWLLINQKSRLDLWKPRGFYVVPTLLHSQPWNGQELRGLFLILFPLFTLFLWPLIVGQNWPGETEGTPKTTHFHFWSSHFPPTRRSLG